MYTYVKLYEVVDIIEQIEEDVWKSNSTKYEQQYASAKLLEIIRRIKKIERKIFNS